MDTCHNGILDVHSEVGLSGLLHLGQYHGRDLLSGELLGLALVIDLDLGLGAVVDDSEGPVLDVHLDGGIIKLPSDQSLGVKDGVVRVHGHLVLGGITDQTFGVSECDIGRRSSVALGRNRALSLLNNIFLEMIEAVTIYALW